MPWLLLLISAGLIVLIPTAYAGLIGAPYAPTFIRAVRRVFDEIKLGAEDVLVDLGAGDGKIVREAARRGAQAHGIELSPIMWLVAWLRTVRFKNAKITLGNFYHADLTQATVLFAFLMPDNMPRLRQYLATQDIPRGRYLLAYAFPFKGVAPLKVVREPKCAPVYVYSLKALTRS